MNQAITVAVCLIIFTSACYIRITTGEGLGTLAVLIAIGALGVLISEIHRVYLENFK